jgi:hypothetical protein
MKHIIFCLWRTSNPILSSRQWYGNVATYTYTVAATTAAATAANIYLAVD